MADEVTIEEDGPLLLIGVNRPDAHNLWNLEVIQAVSRACKRLADAEHLRVGVIFGHGRLFTAGLDLASVGPLVATGDAAAQALLDWNQRVLGGRDAAEGLNAMIERRTPEFEGR